MIKNLFKKFYCIKQFDNNDSGAACIATISKQYGIKITISKIRDLTSTDRHKITNNDLIKALKNIGFSAKTTNCSEKDFFSKFPLPCITLVIIDKNVSHYIVIHKITKNKILVADPKDGIIEYKPEDFFKVWTKILIIMVPIIHFEKGNSSKGLISRFFGLLLQQKKLLFNIIIASISYTILGILASFYFQILMDNILPNNLLKTLHILSISVIILHLFRSLLNAYRTKITVYFSQSIDISLSLGFYNHLLNLPLNFFNTRKVGEIISRFSDADKIRDAISYGTLSIFIDSSMTFAGGIILYIQNPKMFGIAFIVSILYGLLVLFYKKPFHDINQEEMENNSKQTSFLVESINGIETIKAYNAENEINLKTEHNFINTLKSEAKKSFLWNDQTALITSIYSVGTILILWIGSIDVINGKMTIGQLITFNALLYYYLDPFRNLMFLQSILQTGIVASERLGNIFDIELEKIKNESNKIIPENLKNNIIFNNVNFRYENRNFVLQDINFQINQGDKIALVGESGSGKTTLVKLLLRFYNCEKGEILINNINIRDINLDVLRNKIAYVSQETFLFSMSIKENLCLGNPNISFEDILEISKMTKMHDFINELPFRYDTLLIENGNNLSGGQRQRLAIARAILKKPDILILDEATSNLDSLTENTIINVVHNYCKNITTIIIAHRLSTIIRCNKIFVLENGIIIENGSHSKLVAKKGKYYNFLKISDREKVLKK